MPKKTLVLLPGLLNTRRLFQHQIEGLADIADCLVPELWHYDSLGRMAEAVLAAAPPDGHTGEQVAQKLHHHQNAPPPTGARVAATGTSQRRVHFTPRAEA